jgi:hypothetical protein
MAYTTIPPQKNALKNDRFLTVNVDNSPAHPILLHYR